MANYCDYNMKIIGYPSNVGKALEIIMQNYSYWSPTFLKNPKPHLYRVFEANLGDMRNVTQSIVSMEVYGYCAWSVYSCMMEGPFTYYNDFRPNNPDKKTTMDYISAGTSLIQMCRDLNLYIEVYSDEPGMGFQEHIVINNFGKILIDDTHEGVIHVYADDEEMFKEYYEDMDIELYKQHADPVSGYCSFTLNGMYDYVDDCAFTIGNNIKRMARTYPTPFYNNTVMVSIIPENAKYEDVFTRSKRKDEKLHEYKKQCRDKWMQELKEKGNFGNEYL